MGGILGMAGVAGLAGLTTTKAPAQDEAVVGVEPTCQVEATVAFDTGSSVVDLGGQAKLNLALQWVIEAPGRYLVILGADGPRPEDVRLGAVRVSSVVLFLVSSGVNPGVVNRSNFRELDLSRDYARADADSVIVLACDETTPLP